MTPAPDEKPSNSATPPGTQRLPADALCCQTCPSIQWTKMQMLRAIAREVRAPTALLLGATEILAGEEERLHPEHRRFLDLALAQANRLKRMLDDFGTAVEIYHGPAALDFQPVDLAQVVRECVREYQPRAEQKGLELSADVAPVVRVVGRRDLLHTALSALLDNAVKFTPEGYVRVRLTETAVLDVQDTGIGIPADKKDLIFEPFFQGHCHGGVGLGLGLVKRIVELHGGAVGVLCSTGKGSTFRICLPARES